MKAATSEMLMETTVKPICLAPSMVARSGDEPASRLRNTFSIMTIASSTTKPTDTASAISDRLSMEKPASHISAQVPASDSGTVMPAASVGVARRRNTSTTNITSTAVMASVICMSRTLARMVWVRSARMEMWMSAGIQFLRSSSTSLMWSTVSMMLEFACRVTVSSTAGWRLNQAAEKLLRTPRRTEATSVRRTTVPFALLSTIGLKSRGSQSWPLLPSVTAWPGPSRTPSGPAALALTMALRTSSADRPMAASATGLNWTRTAGCSAPVATTSATPSTCERRCTTTVSAML